MRPTDRDKAEEAKRRANENSTSQFDIVPHLCPACNEPAKVMDPDPNQFVHDDEAGEYGNDRAAYTFHPAKIVDTDHPNPWDRVCVVPERKEYDDGEQLQVFPYKHDFDSDGYQAWQAELDELKQQSRRADENNALSDFADE